MPPQQTNISSEIERDAARLRLDLSIVLRLIKRYWYAFQERWQRPGIALQDLSDRELMDIGLTRSEIDYISPERAIDTLRDRATDLWRRGVI
ncbi:DUF1127 domain-containing protein [Bradyrhizobium barranii subsp. apii]|uniref:DUF1127 domain-containing protein n=1 Tax=Bradyrhizobium barranii subsp. apii TaxID=2819348 RepID=A0A8T5VPL3_9BRAD|nr:DUF1127 domain-containing protein [Bradyrhizobium barranii]UPT90479.1 DUF1127 domain-containing protein [Bradyrhizobium barranii subsp. apii]UPT93732.1 DUF1127 domain-containing protein [Bradyrhizobium barranii subsp. apii]